MKTINLLILVIIVSCSEEPIDREPYYQFDADDNSFIFEIPVDDKNVIQFKNQEGAILKYTLISNKTEKLDHTIGNFWGSSSSTLFYFDQQKLEFDSRDYSLHYPALSLEVFKKSDGGLEGGFYFHRWNDDDCYCGIIFEYYSINEVEISSVIFDDVVYEKVITINSENDLSESEDGTPKNVNKVYIDLKKGLIGFDDLENNRWRLLKTR